MPAPKRTQQKTTADDTIDGTATEVPATGRDLVPVEAPDAVFVALDKADEALVAAEVAGDLIETWAYEFSMGGGSPVRGLSYEGVNQAVRIMNARGIGRISCPPTMEPQFKDTYDSDGNPIWECLAYATDELVGGGAWGLAEAEKFPRKQSGETYTDKMAKRKALSKAQRNAKSALIPGPIKLEILQGVTGANIKRIQTPRQQALAQSGQAQQQRAAATTAEKPKRGAVASAAQQRLIMAKFKENGVNDEKTQRVLMGWIGETIHLDRFPKPKVNDLLDAMGDADAIIDTVTSAAGDESAPRHAQAKYLVAEVLSGGNGQQTLDEGAQG